MNLSRLQKYILLQCFDSKNKLDRKVLLSFYHSVKKKPSPEIMVNSITNSLERLIKRGLLVGFGEITKGKIYIQKVQLTKIGRVFAKKNLGVQNPLPFNVKIKK